MAITYKNLRRQIKLASLKGEADDKDFDQSYPDMFNRAMERIYREYSSSEKQKTKEIEFKEKEGYLDKPIDWESTVSIQYGTGDSADTNAVFLTRQFPEVLIASRTLIEGAPRFYSDGPFSGIDTSKIIISPLPDKNYKAKIAYITRPDFVVVGFDEENLVAQEGDIDDNWIMVKYPSLIYYSTLIESYIHALNKEGVELAEKSYDRTLMSLSSLSASRMVDQSSDRTSD